MKEIDLCSEAKPRYYQLTPNKKDGLILLALYQKELEGSHYFIKTEKSSIRKRAKKPADAGNELSLYFRTAGTAVALVLPSLINRDGGGEGLVTFNC